MQVTVFFLWILVWVCFKGFPCNQTKVMIWKWSKHNLAAKQYASHLNYRGHTLNSQELEIPELYLTQANHSNGLYRPVWVKYNAWNLSYDTHRISANWECEQNSSAASLTPPPPTSGPCLPDTGEIPLLSDLSQIVLCLQLHFTSRVYSHV